MIDAVALWGDEARVAEALAGLFALGATEILVSPVPAGEDRVASLSTIRLLSQVAQSVPKGARLPSTYTARRQPTAGEEPQRLPGAAL